MNWVRSKSLTDVEIEKADDADRFPVQLNLEMPRKGETIPRDMYLAAYEVYCVVHAPQAALVQGNCRGGFSVGEVLAFLYARSFPRNQWRAVCDDLFARGIGIR